MNLNLELQQTEHLYFVRVQKKGYPRSPNLHALNGFWLCYKKKKHTQCIRLSVERNINGLLCIESKEEKGCNFPLKNPKLPCPHG